MTRHARPRSHHEPHHEHTRPCGCDEGRRIIDDHRTHGPCWACDGSGEITVADCDCDECAATYPAWFAAPNDPDTGLPDRAED